MSAARVGRRAVARETPLTRQAERLEHAVGAELIDCLATASATLTELAIDD